MLLGNEHFADDFADDRVRWTRLFKCFCIHWRRGQLMTGCCHAQGPQAQIRSICCCDGRESAFLTTDWIIHTLLMTFHTHAPGNGEPLLVVKYKDTFSLDIQPPSTAWHRYEPATWSWRFHMICSPEYNTIINNITGAQNSELEIVRYSLIGS